MGNEGKGGQKGKRSIRIDKQGRERQGQMREFR